MGGNFYQLRDWSDDDWTKARDLIKAQNEKGPRGEKKAKGASAPARTQSLQNNITPLQETHVRAAERPCRHGPRAGEEPRRCQPSNSRGAKPLAEFDRKTNRVANALNAMGVKPGERIAYLGKNSDIISSC